MLIAANHPNSFLDAILLCALHKQPIYCLARGDAFKNKWVAKILQSLNMFAVYRVSEGVENLEENYKTFAKCIQIFNKQGIVLIFSEGRCVNEWKLRPLKKGTARLALTAWQQGIPLKVVPLGINYQSYNSFGKNIILNYGKPIQGQSMQYNSLSFGASVLHFNEKLQQQLQKLVIQIAPPNKLLITNTFAIRVSIFKKILLAIPAAIGYIMHAPLYMPIKQYCFKKFSKIDHYDSALIGLLFITYPIYLLIISTSLFAYTGQLISYGIVLIMPIVAWAFVQIKKQF